MKQRIVVLGAGGFIGRHIVSALAASDWAAPVAAAPRAAGGTAGVETLQLDATSATALAPALTGAYGVVNCVAGSTDIIVDGARALFDLAARMVPPPRVIHFSSMAVYGAAIGSADETAELRGDLGPYSVAKVAAEALAWGHHNVVSLRPGCVYGGHSPQWSERVARWLQAFRLGDLGPAGDGICNLVHIDDVVAATLRALRSPEAGGQAFNLAMSSPPTWNEYFIAYARALGAVPVRRISQLRLQLEGKLLAPPLKIAEILARKAHLRLPPPPVPPSLLRAFRQELLLDSRKAERVLAMQWTPLERGLTAPKATV